MTETPMNPPVQYTITEDIANKVCAVLVNAGENRLANKLCSRHAPAAPEYHCPAYEYCPEEHKCNNCPLHQPLASPDNADMLLNNLLAKFMLANKRGNFRPWNIQHIQQEIEYFREELRQSRQHPNGKQDVNCHACLEGLCQPCNHPVEGCPYYEPKQDGV